MTLGRDRSIPLVLLALVILVATPAGAQDGCCTCDYPGGGCSACCYEDQIPRCTVFPDGSCGCYCNPGGPAGGCDGLSVSSRTLAIGSDEGPELADHQLRFGLVNAGDRREGSFVFEEWALVSSAGEEITVPTASSAEFRNRVQLEAERFRPSGSGTTVLVIEDAEHPHNSREIPVPEVAPIDFDAGLPASAAGQEAWFRVEIGEDGVVDQVIVLNRPEVFASASIHEGLRKHLSLRYADKERHRAVVFGVLRADATGRLTMTTYRVVLPTCCCGGVRCA